VERFDVSRRAVAGIVIALAALVAAGSFAQGEGADAAAGAPRNKIAAVGPDVTVFAFTDIGNYGSSGGFAGYAIGTRSCNRGDAPLSWCEGGFTCAAGAGTEDHPVIAQNLYRLKDGRFEQVGMSWLKHGFESTNSTTAGCSGASGQSCTQPPSGPAQLGVGCTDPYVSSLNGSRPAGRRSEVNATTGVFPYPYSSPGGPYQVYDQRLKVSTNDLAAAQNPGALYYGEAQYIAGDDALAGNGLNNASYRRVTVGASPNYALTLTGTFFEKQPAINAWPAADPTVMLIDVDVPSSPVERYQVARKVTDIGGGLWHYEYAVRNHNSARSARSLTVAFPVPTTISGVGFKDIESHSGEPYSTADWSVSTTSTSVSWFTDTFAVNPNANALRFATMFNFWFDADQPPSDSIGNALELFTAGSPTSVSFSKFNELFSNGFESGATGAWSGST
jgi:hypothetical protein